MRRVTPEIKARLLKLYKKGYSLSNLSKLLNLSKTTIYYYAYNRFRKVYLEGKFNPALQHELGEFVGAFIGDGYFFYNPNDWSYETRIYLSDHEHEYAERLSTIIKKVFGRGCTTRIWPYPGKKELILKMYRKAIYEKLLEHVYWRKKKALTVGLKPPISRYSDSFISGVIAGLIASDGDVSTQSRRIGFSTSSPILAGQYQEMLKRFKIESHVYSYNPKTKHRPHREYKIVITNGRKGGNLNRFAMSIDLTETNKRERLDRILSALKNQYN